MFAIILAAGRGERMRPLTDKLPKPLLAVNDKPLIEYHLENLQQTDIKSVVVNHAWLGHLIPKTLGNGDKWDLNLNYSDEGNNALETAGGIKKILTTHNDDYFVVVNGDVWTDFDFSLLPNSLPTGVLAHLILVNNPTQHPEGDFALSNQWLQNDGKKKFTFSGIAVYHRCFFENVAEELTALGPVIRQHISNNQVTGEIYQGQWFDIGTPERLHDLDDKLRNEHVIIK